MDPKSEIRDFLTSRRARLTPEQAGLPTYGERRVPGLRREEVAVLAGVSVDYYTRLERGNLSGASEGVLEALAQALKLDEAERAHLGDLARAAQPGPRKRSRGRKPTVRPSVQWTLDAMPGCAALVENGRLDLLATNDLGCALFAPVVEEPGAGNFARFIFFDPRAQDLFDDWDRAAGETAALLRLEAGRDPRDGALTDLVGQLSTRAEAFRSQWATHSVRLHHHDTKRFQHPIAGEIELSYNRLDFPGEPGLILVAYTAEPGSRSAEALDLLASWAATEKAAADAIEEAASPDGGASET